MWHYHRNTTESWKYLPAKTLMVERGMRAWSSLVYDTCSEFYKTPNTHLMLAIIAGREVTSQRSDIFLMMIQTDGVVTIMFVTLFSSQEKNVSSTMTMSIRKTWAIHQLGIHTHCPSAIWYINIYISGFMLCLWVNTSNRQPLWYLRFQHVFFRGVRTRPTNPLVSAVHY